MSIKVINGNMHICRTSQDKINIEIECHESRNTFLKIDLTLEQFAFLVTGCHQSDIKMEVRELDRVGKRRIREERTIISPLTTSDRDEHSQWLRENCQEEGYLLNSLLTSQSSVKWVDGVAHLRYSVMKWIDIEE